VVVTVTDNGTGLTAQQEERIFEPFFTTKEPGRGTGLGLSISYAIVQNHDGRITCESREGERTTFRVAFPQTSQA
jgi:signal transduction histidine kinase